MQKMRLMKTTIVKRILVSIQTILILFGGTADCLAQQATVISNPGPFSRIEKAATSEINVNWWDADLADDRACTECFAALELAHYLTYCTSLSEDEILLRSQGNLPKKGDVFLVGSKQSNSLIASFDLPDNDQLKTDESFRLWSFQDNNRTVTIIEGKDRVGTLYGVYAYLEQLGISFYGLGEKGTVYPTKPVELPQSLNIIKNPSFLTRGFWAWEDRGNNDFFLWMARNRMNLWTAEEKDIHFLKKLGLILGHGGHIIQEYCIAPNSEYPYNHLKFQGDEDKPNDPYAPGDEYTGDTNNDGKLTYFEAHPEWYGLRNGERSDHINGEIGDNYCTSNLDATKELAKNLIQCLIDGCYSQVDILNLWMLDNGKWCECDNCKQQGIYTDRLLAVCDLVLNEIHQAQQDGRLQRKVQLSTLAYHETLPPPTKSLPADFNYDNFSMTFFPIERCYVHPFADPACTEINHILLENYQGWTMGQGRFYKGSMFIGEYYNVSSFKSLPVLFPGIMAADIPWYFHNGARHLHYMHTPTRLWGTWTLNQYLLAQLLWNTDTDVDTLLDDYFHRYYPTTTEQTRTFYQHLEAATANIKPLKHYVGIKGVLNIDGIRYLLRRRLIEESDEIFPTEHLHYDVYNPILNDGPDIVEIVDAMRLARKEIDAALMQCTDKIEQTRLMEDERRFAYGEAMIFFYYHLVRTAIFHRHHNEILARNEFSSVERFAKRLEEITDLVQVSSSDANAKDGLEATQAMDEYKFFKEKYGK